MTTFDSQTLSIIRRAPVFSQIDQPTLLTFLEQCQIVPLKAQSYVFRPSQQADKFFLVLQGQVKIYKLSAGGDEQLLHRYGPGETFGEAAMWAKVPFPAHAQAVDEVRLLVVSRAALARALARNAELAMGMLAGLSAKLREFNQLIEQLSLKDVPARLALVLLKEGARRQNKPFRLGRTKRELASEIGTVPETLSRALAKMRDQGVIRVKGAEITILDLEALEELAHHQ